MHPPTRHALIIGSPRTGLTAAEASARHMRTFLAARGFVTPDDRFIVGERATRAAILAAFDALIAAVHPGDAVVVYYAGHGNLFPDRRPLAVLGALPESHPLLEPMDIADSDAEHFNGLLGGELRLLLRALARLCDNLTAILDCCHAAGMVAADQPARGTPEAADRAAVAAIAARAGQRIALRRAEQAPVQFSAPSPNPPAAVRLVASSASERAYYNFETGLLLFTEALTAALADPAHAHLPWDPLLRLVRARVQELRPEQRPAVEGDRHCLPFTSTPADLPADHFHVDHRREGLHLAAGRASGLVERDTFELFPYTDLEARLTTATLRTLGPFSALLEPGPAPTPLPPILIARRIRHRDGELAARIASADNPIDRTAADARTTASRRTTKPGDPITAYALTSPPLAYGARPSPLVDYTAPVPGHTAPDPTVFHLRPPIVRPDTPPNHLDLLDELDPDGDRLPPQLVARINLTDPHAPDTLTRALRRLERWAGLAARITHTGLGPLRGCYELAWGRLGHDRRLDPWRRTDHLPDGVTLGLRLHNPGLARALHVQAFRVRADRRIEPLRDAAGGLGVPTGHQLLLRETFERLPGLPGPQREWLLVVLGDGALDLPIATPDADLPLPFCAPPPAGLEATRVEILGIPYILAAAP